MSTMTKPELGERFAIQEGLGDFRERVIAPRPLSDEEMTAILVEIGNKTILGEDGDEYVLFENRVDTQIATIEGAEVPVVHEHDDCEVCPGLTGYRVGDITSITYLNSYRRDAQGVPAVEARFARDDNLDWMFTPGNARPLATNLGRVAERLLGQQ